MANGLRFVTARRELVNASAIGVAHVMATDRGIVPVGDVKRPDRHVGGAEPGIGTRNQRLHFEGVTGGLGLNPIGSQLALACFGVQWKAAVALGKKRALVDHETARRAGSQPRDVRHDSGILLMEMRAAILTPEAATRSPVAVVAALHHVVEACPRVAVVVVVGLPDVAERVERELVRIAEIMRQHSESASIEVHTQSRTRVVRTGSPAYPALTGFVDNVEARIA